MKRFSVFAAMVFLASCSPAAEAPPPPPPAAPSPPPPPVYEIDRGYSVEASPVEVGEVVTITARRARAVERPMEPVIQPPSAFDDVVSQLSAASFAYSWPDRVNVEESFNVSLGVNPTMTAQQVRDEIGGSDAAIGRVQISKILIAKLAAPDFKIHPITPERQAIDLSQTTQWKWKLQPIRAGADREINLTIIAVVQVGDEKAERYVETFDGVITVDVTTKQRVEKFVQDHWQWGFSALLVPLGAMLIAWWRRRKKKPDQ